MRGRRPARRAYTLVELAAVLTMLAVVAATAVPTGGAVMDRVEDGRNTVSLAAFADAARVPDMATGLVTFTVERLEEVAATMTDRTGAQWTVVTDTGTFGEPGWVAAWSSSYRQVHVAVAADGSAFGAAMVSRPDASCVFTRVEPGGSDEWLVAADLGAACSGTVALNDDRDPGPVADTGIVLPDAPDPEIAELTATTATVTWPAVGDASGYRTSTGGVVVCDAAEPGCAVTGLNPGGAHTFTVVAYNAWGSSPPGTVSTTTVLAAPDVTATALSAAAIRVDWSSVPGAAGYLVTYPDGTVLADTTALTHTDPGLTADTLYEYRVVAYSAAGAQSAPATASATTLPLPPAAPSPTATAQSATAIELTWPAVTGATGYVVSRADGTVLADTTATAYTDTGLTPDTLYEYRVAASNTGGTSAAGEASATTLPLPPAAPDPSASALSATAIELTWPAVSGATGYRVSLADGTVLGETTATTYTDSGRAPATTYAYRVVAFNAGGDSPAGEASATTLPLPPAAPAPSASALSSTAIRVTWPAVSGATGYRVSLANGTVLASQTATSFDHTMLSPNTVYSYRVVAVNTGGDSPAGTTSATTLPLPPSAPAPTASALSTTSIRVTWPAVSGATGYRVSLANGTVLTSQTGTTFDHTGLSPATTYSYRVVAFNAGGDSPAGSASATTTTPTPVAPTTAGDCGALTGPSATGVCNVSWTTPSWTSYFRVQTVGVSDTGFYTTTATTASFQGGIGLAVGDYNVLRVQACNAQGVCSSLATGGSRLMRAAPRPAAPTVSWTCVAMFGVCQATIQATWAQGYHVRNVYHSGNGAISCPGGCSDNTGFWTSKSGPAGYYNFYMFGTETRTGGGTVTLTVGRAPSPIFGNTAYIDVSGSNNAGDGYGHCIPPGVGISPDPSTCLYTVATSSQ